LCVCVRACALVHCVLCRPLLAPLGLMAGAMHLFGWGRPINRYKAYACFCRAFSGYCLAGFHNRAVCDLLGIGCKQNGEYGRYLLRSAELESSPLAVRLMTLVCRFILYFVCDFPSHARSSLDQSLGLVQVNSSITNGLPSLAKALGLDAGFPPALCETKVRLAAAQGVSETEISSAAAEAVLQSAEVQALMTAFKRGFLFAGYRYSVQPSS
jgi:hypothetical protein